MSSSTRKNISWVLNSVNQNPEEWVPHYRPGRLVIRNEKYDVRCSFTRYLEDIDHCLHSETISIRADKTYTTWDTHNNTLALVLWDTVKSKFQAAKWEGFVYHSLQELDYLTEHTTKESQILLPVMASALLLLIVLLCNKPDSRSKENGKSKGSRQVQLYNK